MPPPCAMPGRDMLGRWPAPPGLKLAGGPDGRPPPPGRAIAGRLAPPPGKPPGRLICGLAPPEGRLIGGRAPPEGRLIDGDGRDICGLEGRLMAGVRLMPPPPPP